MSMTVKSGACCRPIDDESCRERAATAVDDEIRQGLAAATTVRLVGAGQMRWRAVEDAAGGVRDEI
jgi:hypothetical protein